MVQNFFIFKAFCISFESKKTTETSTWFPEQLKSHSTSLYCSPGNTTPPALLILFYSSWFSRWNPLPSLFPSTLMKRIISGKTELYSVFKASALSALNTTRMLWTELGPRGSSGFVNSPGSTVTDRLIHHQHNFKGIFPSRLGRFIFQLTGVIYLVSVPS